MVLERSQIEEKLKLRSNADVVGRAVLNEERLRFHGVTMTSGRCVNRALNRFLDYVKAILQSEEKYKLFTTFMRFPIATNPVVENIFTELNKVFYGQNFVNIVTFSNTDAAADWESYSKDSLKLHELFEERAMGAMSNGINSVIVVDLPSEQTTDRPEPYFYFLDIANVECFEVKPDTDVFEWIAFHTGVEDEIAVYDDMYYRLYHENERGELDLIRESVHGLGRVPAFFFWRDYMYADDKCVKRSPITKELDKLDYLLFKLINQRIAMLGAEYPVTWAFEAEDDCDYHTDEVHCENGYLMDSTGVYVHNTEGGVMECPICSKKGYRGAGTHIVLPIPDGDQPDISNPVGIMVTPTDTLKFIDSSVKDLVSEVFTDVVGKDGYFSENSMSDTQISSNFESRKSTLMKLKGNFEEAEKNIIRTVCELRYKEGEYVGCTVDYGTEFYLYNVEELRDRYKKAKEAGASESELSYIDHQIVCTELRNNPEQLERTLLLRRIEPYRNLTIAEVKSNAMDGAVDPELYAIKMNFPSLIDRFEREHCDVAEFGSALKPSEKINKIIETLKLYVREYGKNFESRSGDSRDGEPTGGAAKEGGSEE